MVVDQDPREQSESDDETDERIHYSSDSDTDPTTVLIPLTTMNRDQKGDCGDQERGQEQICPAKSRSTPSPNSEEPEICNGSSCNNNKQNCRRNSQSQSLVGSAHIQLQLFVEDVKVELKELTTQCTGTKSKAEKKSESADENGNEKVSEEKDEKKKKPRTGWRRYLGIILAVSSSALFALCILIVKSLPEYHPYSVSLWRFQGILLPAIPVAFYCRVIKKEKIFDRILPITAPDHLKTLFFLFVSSLHTY